jgi:hypothetical protein
MFRPVPTMATPFVRDHPRVRRPPPSPAARNQEVSDWEDDSEQDWSSEDEFDESSPSFQVLKRRQIKYGKMRLGRNRHSFQQIKTVVPAGSVDKAGLTADNIEIPVGYYINKKGLMKKKNPPGHLRKEAGLRQVALTEDELRQIRKNYDVKPLQIFQNPRTGKTFKVKTKDDKEVVVVHHRVRVSNAEVEALTE